ncbi:solute carrier family 35 member G1-like [Parasteatoda tepidariorum]|uniref:solute carrier family 35 member G1-like n=1 Tax=Parasteatoda tepidariorum TaxID=114398 RepID=UPI001C72904C|nr:solute carrier family 35 member G1-like [Parasteatoda tepidariorum]
MVDMINISTFKSLILSMLSGILHSVAVANSQLLEDLHAGQMTTYHFIAIAAFSLPETVKSAENIFGPKSARMFLLAQSICGSISTFLTFISYEYLPIGVSIIIRSTRPAFFAVAANILLDEPCGLLLYITTTLTIIAIIFTAQVPPYLFDDSFSYSNEFLYGIAAAILSLVFTAGQVIITRKLKTVNHAVVTFNSNWMSAIWTGVFASIFGHFKWHECGLQKLYVILFGFASYASQTLLVIAFQYELVSPVSTVRAASNIISSLLLQIFLFCDIPDVYSTIGAALVGLSFLIVGMKKCIPAMPKDS